MYIYMGPARALEESESSIAHPLETKYGIRRVSNSMVGSIAHLVTFNCFKKSRQDMQQTKNVERSGKLDRPPTPNKPIQKHLKQSGKLNRTSTRNNSYHKAPCEIKVESPIAHPLACLSYSDVKRYESKRHAPRFFCKRLKLERRPVS